MDNKDQATGGNRTSSVDNAEQLEVLQTAIEELRRRSEVNSLQIDEMQIAVSKGERQKRPWYREVATLISVLALVASVAATILTYSI